MLKFAATRWFKKLTEWARQLGDANPAVRAKAEANIRRLYNFNKQHPLRTIYTLDKPGLMQRWQDTLRRKGQFFRLQKGTEPTYHYRAATIVHNNTLHSLAHESFEYLVGGPKVRKALKRIGSKERNILLSRRALNALPPQQYTMTPQKKRVELLATLNREKPGLTKQLLIAKGLKYPETHFPNVLGAEHHYDTLMALHPQDSIRKEIVNILIPRRLRRDYKIHLVALDPKTTKPIVLAQQKIIGANEYEASSFLDKFIRQAKRRLRRKARRDNRFRTIMRTMVWPWQSKASDAPTRDIGKITSSPEDLLRLLWWSNKPTVTTKWYWDKL